MHLGIAALVPDEHAARPQRAGVELQVFASDTANAAAALRRAKFTVVPPAISGRTDDGLTER